MPDKDKNFGGSLVLDFRKWWRHMQAKNMAMIEIQNRRQKKNFKSKFYLFLG